MLPESLKNAFQLYKRDTNAIATWLANTANNNGHRVYANGDKTSGRKGKAQNKLKAATPADEEESSSNKKKRYLLPLRDFVPLATFIVSVKPQIRVPLFMAVTIDRVIEVRRTVTRIMGTKEDDATEESTVNHLHFVAVLEQVRNILSSSMPTDIPDISSLEIVSNANTSATKEDKKVTSRNPFDILDLYETTEQVDDLDGTDSPSDLIIEYEPEPQDLYHDACLAFVSLLRAVLYQRQKVRELWHNYKVGRVFLGPTAIGTNEAIDICRRMEEDVASVISKGANVVDLLSSVFTIMCQLEGQDLRIPGRRNPTNWDTYDVASLTMSHVGRILQNVASENRQGGLNVYNGSQGWYHRSMERASSNNRQKYAQDKKALIEVISDIRILGIVSDKKTTEDEFTRGVHTLLNNNEVTLWQCFAAQIYLDVLYELQGSPDLAWSEMVGTSDMIRSSLASALKNPGDVHLVEYWREMEESLMELKSAAAEWDNDPIARYKTERDVPAESNQFLRRHPLYCGVWVHEMRVRFHEAGIDFTSAFGYVHQTYQLYHALRQERLLGTLAFWRDMESLFQMQGQDTLFVGSAPNTAQGYLDNLRLKSGLSVNDRSQGKNKGKNKRLSLSNSERGQLKELGAMSMLFKKRFRKTSRRGEMTAKYLQKIIESNGFRFVKKGDGTWDLVKSNAVFDSERLPTPDIPSTQLIVCVTMALRSEAHLIAFNYFLLHIDCVKILGEIRKTIDDHTVQRLAPESAKQKHLPSAVAMIFRDAAGNEPQELLQRAATVVKRHLLEPYSMASTLGMRDLGFHPCRCPQNIGRSSAATQNCMSLQCGMGHLV